jgi:hypothetical protein
LTDPQDIGALFRSAIEIVDQAGVPDDLRPVAFAHAIDLIRLQPARETSRVDLHEASESEPGNKVARHFGIRPELLDYIYDTNSDGLELVLHRSKLPIKKSPAMRVIALLVAASRQAAGIEDWTHVALIRDVCRQFGVLDPANFATEVGSLGDIFLVRGKGQSREFKVTRHGFEEAGQAILKLTSSDAR